MSRDITIFISSRFYEFRELRDKIIKEKFSKLDVGLRLNMLEDRDGIADTRSPDIMSIEEASSSDIFILLLGESYKEILDNEKSYTHQEYDSAIKNGLHILAFPIGDCYAPNNQKLSNHYLFREFQDDVLTNKKKHTTAPYTPSDYNIDEMYEKIYKSLKEFIINQLNKSIKKKRKGLQLTSKLGKSTIIGRKKELQEIDQQLNSSNALLLINGIGGVGKSNIASYYLHSHKEEFDYYGFFEGLDSFIVELREPLDLKAEKPQEAFLEALSKLRKLEGDKLLVLDDVKEIEENQDRIDGILALKESGYKILFTSREDIENIKPYYLDVLSLDDAKALFNSIYFVEDEALLEEILGYLDCHAFFIEMTAKSLKVNTQRTLQKIIEMFRDGKLSKIKANKDESFNDYLNERFSLDNLDEEDILLLKQLSLLPSIEIDFKFLIKIFALTDEENIEDFQDLLNFLVQKGWLTKTNKGYKLHQIIKEFIWANHKPTLEEMDKIVLFFANIIKNNDIQSAVLLKGYFVYFEAINDVLNRIEVFNEKITVFFANLGFVYYYNGFYKEAKPFWEKVVQITEKILGRNHIDTINAYNNLGGLYTELGDYENAENILLKGLEISKNTFGENHTSVYYHNLANLYQEKKEYKKAKYFFDKALEKVKNISDIDNSKKLILYANLAKFYTLIEEYKEAEYITIKILQVTNKIWGDNHPHIITYSNHLGTIYMFLHEYKKSEKFYFQALKKSNQILRKNHPTIATSYNGLATLYFNIKKFKKAHKYIKKAINIWANTLPKNHSDLMNAKRGLEIIERSL